MSPSPIVEQGLADRSCAPIACGMHTAARAARAERLGDGVRARLVERYGELLCQGVAATPLPPPPAGSPKRGRRRQSPARTLLDRLFQRQDEVLAFLDDVAVPLDHHQAERDLRRLKVQQNISGGFCSPAGAAAFCRIRRVLSTLHQAGAARLATERSLFADGSLPFPAMTGMVTARTGSCALACTLAKVQRVVEDVSTRARSEDDSLGGRFSRVNTGRCERQPAMSSIFSSHSLWSGNHGYVTAQADLLHHHVDPAQLDLGTSCLITFSSSVFHRMLAIVPTVENEDLWPYRTTPLRVCRTSTGRRFALHFPSYGGPRIANSLEQLAACGIRSVFGLGLGGTPQEHVPIGELLLIEGALRGDGVSRYYAPLEYPAVADCSLTALVRAQLEKAGEHYITGLSFGTDALYREDEQLVAQLRTLGVLSVDLESSALLTVGRRLGLSCCWTGVVSDRLVTSTHEGNIHADHVMDTVVRLGQHLVEIIA
jgi:uridine phosphorylase